MFCIFFVICMCSIRPTAGNSITESYVQLFPADLSVTLLSGFVSMVTDCVEFIPVIKLKYKVTVKKLL